MNDPNQRYLEQSYGINRVNDLPQYEYDPGVDEYLKFQAEQISIYDNHPQRNNQLAYNFNLAGQPNLASYQDNDLQTLQEFQHGRYQDYTPSDLDLYSQNQSSTEFSPGSQNFSPSSYSLDSRQFQQDQLEGVMPSVTQYQQDLQPMHQVAHCTASREQIPQMHSNDSSFADLKSQARIGNNITDDSTKSVNGILEMEGRVEPNGPILGGHGYIPAQTMQKAYYELGETPEIKAACIRGFRQQIEIHQEENNFDEHSDAFLLKFLRSRKFDVEAAYSLLEKYYNVRENKPEVFRNLTRKNVKRTMEQGIVGVLPQRDKKGRVILTFNFSKWNMSLPFHFEKLLRVFVYTLEKLFESEETQINGVAVICSLSQLSVLQTKSLGSAMIEKVVEIFEGNFPFRLNAIHLLNPPWHFKLMWKMVDPLTKIKQKIARRIFIHDGDLSRFNAEFDEDILPKELGGKCPPYDNSLWVKEILEPEQAQQQQSQKLQATQPTQNQRKSPSVF